MSGSLSEYEVTTDGGYKTTLLLTDDDAKARGLTKAKAAEEPANKARQATANKSA